MTCPPDRGQPPPRQVPSHPVSSSPGTSPFAPGPQPTAARPEAIAIALGYEHDRDVAPRVVASGRGAVAEQILEIAFANGIKVRQDADLATLLATVEIDSLIPLEAFAAVAEIIAYLYRANAQLAADPAEMPTGRPARLALDATAGAFPHPAGQTGMRHP